MFKSLFKRYAAIAVFITLLLLSGSAGAENCPEYYRLRLAVPVGAPVMDSTINLPYQVNRLYVDLLLRVDTGGKVSEVIEAEPADSNYVKYYRDYLKTMRFRPGTFEKKPVEQTLPVRLRFKAHQRLPELTFPVDREARIQDRDFYFAALGRNGVTVPRIESFPSYNYKFKRTLSDSLIYPYFLVKLNLDETGRPTKIEKLTAASPPYTDQIMIVINWGRYAPLEIRGKPAASECFLLITHLPQANYPACVYTAGDSTLSLRDRVRVRLLPDTVGLMSPPLPRNIIDNKIVCASIDVFGNGEATVLVAIDTLGKARMVRLMPPILKKKVLAALPDLKFYPALDFQGRRQPYKGYLRLSFNATKTVSVDMTWFSH